MMVAEWGRGVESEAKGWQRVESKQGPGRKTIIEYLMSSLKQEEHLTRTQIIIHELSVFPQKIKAVEECIGG